MATANHVIVSLYGFWLPNDPHGLWSQYVEWRRLLAFGDPTKPAVRRSRVRAANDTRFRLASKEAHDERFRLASKETVGHPPMRLSERQAVAVASGFAQACAEGGYEVHACSILTDHIQLVIGRHVRRVGRIVAHMKARATQRLKAEGLWPADGDPVWGGPGWCVYLNTPDDVRSAIAYVEAFPEQEGKPRQAWAFVKPFADNGTA